MSEPSPYARRGLAMRSHHRSAYLVGLIAICVTAIVSC